MLQNAPWEQSMVDNRQQKRAETYGVLQILLEIQLHVSEVGAHREVKRGS